MPEVWRFRPTEWEMTFCIRAEDGFRVSDQSLAFPVLKPADVLSQMELAKSLVLTRGTINSMSGSET